DGRRRRVVGAAEIPRHRMTAHEEWQPMKIALVQINPTIGDLAGNARLILDALAVARGRGADLAVTPELSLVGYFPRDLLLSAEFVRRSWTQLEDVARRAEGLPPALVGIDRKSTRLNSV